jgi:hypothetical protein
MENELARQSGARSPRSQSPKVAAAVPARTASWPAGELGPAQPDMASASPANRPEQLDETERRFELRTTVGLLSPVADAAICRWCKPRTERSKLSTSVLNGSSFSRSRPCAAMRSALAGSLALASPRCTKAPRAAAIWSARNTVIRRTVGAGAGAALPKPPHPRTLAELVGYPAKPWSFVEPRLTARCPAKRAARRSPLANKRSPPTCLTVEQSRRYQLS